MAQEKQMVELTPIVQQYRQECHLLGEVQFSITSFELNDFSFPIVIFNHQAYLIFTLDTHAKTGLIPYLNNKKINYLEYVYQEQEMSVISKKLLPDQEKNNQNAKHRAKLM